MKQYLHDMDIPQIVNACRYAGFTEEVIGSIWEDKTPGVVWREGRKR